VSIDATACGATNLIIRVVNKEMLKLGLNTFGNDHRLRELICQKVLYGLQMMQGPTARVLIAASAPAPTRAEALLASGLVDLAMWITELADTLTKSVVEAVEGNVPATAVNAVIKRTIVMRINADGR
jgi:hypothetical protein